MKKILLVLTVLSLFILSFTLVQKKTTTPKATAKTKTTKVKISTKHGDMVLILYNETPLHRDNFIKLVKSKYFDGTLFHRVIKGFMIQGGDPESKTAKPGAMLGNGGPAYTIPAEFNNKLYYKFGALAAARDNNPQKASSGSQFYVVEGRKISDDELNYYEKQRNMKYTDEQRNKYKTVGGTPQLDGGYTVFGEVISGFEVIGKIAGVAKDKFDRPNEDVKMTVTIVK